MLASWSFQQLPNSLLQTINERLGPVVFNQCTPDVITVVKAAVYVVAGLTVDPASTEKIAMPAGLENRSEVSDMYRNDWRQAETLKPDVRLDQ